MSDINNTDLENEEASALFVSAQKKKKADEEARKKAEEEEAKRQAAEAEVRRMEEEVEERKRKAEEEKIALENAMKEEAAKAEALKEEAIKKEAERAKAAQSSESAQKGGTPAGKPMIIGIAAAAVIAAIILVVVLSRGGKGGMAAGPAVDYQSLELNAAYTSQKEGMDIEIAYPDSLYTDVTEKMGASDTLSIHFAPESEKEVATDVVIATPIVVEGSHNIAWDNAAFFSPDDIKTMMKKTAEEQLKLIDENAVISDESISEYDENNPGQYYYTFSFSSDEKKSGAAACWLELAGDDEYKTVMIGCSHPKEGVEDVQTLCDKLFTENSVYALEMPGANPPESAKADDLIEVERIHMGLHVPKEWFIKYPRATNFDMYIDQNGAFLYSSWNETSIPEGSELTDEGRQAVEDIIDGETPPGFECESREKTAGEWIYSMTYMTEYDDVIGGVRYWEKAYVFDWTDLQTGKQYFARIVIGCPEKDKDIYSGMIDEMFKTKEDI